MDNNFFNNKNNKKVSEEKNLKNAIDEIIAHKNKTTPKESIIETETNQNNIENDKIFEFQKNDSSINYIETFSRLRKNKNLKANVQKDSYENKAPTNSTDLKTKLYSSGYKVRAYQRSYTEEFYSMNYFLSNKLNMFCSIFSYLFAILMVAINWICFNKYLDISVTNYIIIMVSFLVVPLANLIIYLVKPTKRKKVQFNPKLSLLNTTMIFLVCFVILFLIGFFGVGANINNWTSMILPIIFPSLILVTIPISSIIYTILYKSKKFHIE